METEQIISEGLATVKTGEKVFYNPVQEFNRDLRLVFIFILLKLIQTDFFVLLVLRL